MSLDTKKIDEIKRIYYRGARLIGYSRNEDYISPQEMLKIYENYERMLLNRNFNSVRISERRRKVPLSWLNCVISGLINDKKNGLSKDLVKEFKDRGFSKYFLSK